MQTLEAIDMEYELRMEIIDKQLENERALRKLNKALKREKKMKDLVRHTVLFLATFFVVALTCYLYFFSEPKFDVEDWEVDAYVVEYGDTLWEIGEEVTDDKIDIRVWIHEVKKLNNMNNASIDVRDVIKIYVPKEN